jgi:hypothetical protein
MSTGPDPLNVKYAPGAEQARQNVMIGVSVVMTFIGGQSVRARCLFVNILTSQVTCVMLRVYTRGCIVRNMGREDWTMVAAAVSHVENCANNITEQSLDTDYCSHVGIDCRS